MQNKFDIRNARSEDAPVISNLIMSVAHYFCPNSGGKLASWFLDSVMPVAIEGCVNDPEYNYLVAYSGRNLVGVIAVRCAAHVHHLFVAPEVHRQGIAACLWERAKNDAMNSGNKERFFVRSSEYAVPVYKNFGFRVAGDRAEKDGVVFVPMRLDLSNDRG